MSLFRFVLDVLAFAGSACAVASDVGVSVTIGQPGFYGRIEIGDMPRPRLLYSEPVVIEVVPVQVVRHPLYLRVPPGHAKHWDKHCAEYGACGHPVYFVDDDYWYENVYVSEYDKKHGKHHGKSGKGHGKDRSHKERRFQFPWHGTHLTIGSKGRRRFAAPPLNLSVERRKVRSVLDFKLSSNCTFRSKCRLPQGAENLHHEHDRPRGNRKRAGGPERRILA